jgi:hypothetical protein
MYDEEGHYIDDPLYVVNVKPDFSDIGLKPIKRNEQCLKK